ncbi:hypothetical protein ACS0TY_000127 [Phlomoides rotata]
MRMLGLRDPEVKEDVRLQAPMISPHLILCLHRTVVLIPDMMFLHQENSLIISPHLSLCLHRTVVIPYMMFLHQHMIMKMTMCLNLVLICTHLISNMVSTLPKKNIQLKVHIYLIVIELDSLNM